MRVMNKYGEYVHHLASLMEGPLTVPLGSSSTACIWSSAGTDYQQKGFEEERVKYNLKRP